MEKRRERQRPSWDEYHMLAATRAATRSSCLYLPTGAVIVKGKREIASGYNGAPQRIENCLNIGCRKEKCNVPFDEKGKGVCRGTHAEWNALDQISRWDLEEESASMYTLYYPCSACAKAIVQSGIRRVVFARHYLEKDSLTEEIFKEADVIRFQLDIDIDKALAMMKAVWEWKKPEDKK